MAGLLALAVYLWTQPRTLTLAVGPLGSDDARLAAALVQGLSREKKPVRLRLVLTEGSAESARKIDAGKVDLAIVRPDIALPAKADTALITRRSFPFFIGPGDLGIDRVSGLRGKRIGVVRAPAGNLELLKLVLSQYEVRLEEVTVVALGPEDVQAAIAERHIDALFAVNALNARVVTEVGSRLRRAFGEHPTVIPIREADALAARNRAIESGEIVRGALGGDPPLPAENLPSISITSRLMAAQTLDDNRVGELVGAILSLRVTLAADLPAIQGLEAPATDKDAPLAVHSGAAAFIDGEQESFFERYGDWFYLGVMALSLVGSGAAGLLGVESATRRKRAMADLGRLVVLLGAMRTAADEPELAAMEREADAILAGVLANYARGDIDSGGIGAYRFAMDQLGRAAAERRIALLEAAAD
ncbi:TAXI family TRAP transporter solute-binding subunit [Bosea sp. CS1GBMeth4]|uniref:TAXI family TRAP transporter solute-binding subunit n=1 Tax=Bosea sp. CS1GBMeth4 TaxID=1892849 RepID=UPI001646EA7A|nr:TAXI family TRAP transporter solute-binding subunit [Bosea sp. CS1GBMeth4]